MPQIIELQRQVEGVRGPRAQGGAFVPGVADGQGQALGEIGGRVGEAFVRADLHSGIEHIVAMEEDNQAAEAELAFDRWTRQALYGSPGNETPTALTDFDKEKNPEQQVMKLNGLLHAKGMAAVDGGKMYGAASDTMMRNILGSLSPTVRARVANRLAMKRTATMVRLNEYGVNQGQVAQRERSQALIAAQTREQAEQAALDVAGVETDYKTKVTAIQSGYQTAMANKMTKEQYVEYSKNNPDGFLKYDEYSKSYDATAAKNRDDELAALEASRVARFAQIGTAYALKQTELEAKARAMVLTDLGITEEQAKTEEWAPVVEGRMSAVRQQSGYEFLRSMLGAGQTAFVKDAVKGGTKNNYGITDKRLIASLEQGITRAESANMAARAEEQSKVRYDISRALTQTWTKDAEGNEVATYEWTIEEMEAERNRQAQAGNWDYATLWNEAINKRVYYERTAAETAAGKNDKALDPGDSTPEQWLARLYAVQESEKNYYAFADGDKPFVISKNAYMRWIIENKLNLSEAEKKTTLERVSKGPDRAMASVVRQMRVTGGGLFWQATNVIGDGIFSEGEPTGSIYSMGSIYGRGNVRINENGELEVVDRNVRGVMYVRDDPNNPEFLTALPPESVSKALNLAVDYVRNFVESNPTATQTEIDRKSAETLQRLFVGSPENGMSQLERESDLLSDLQRLQQIGSMMYGRLVNLDERLNDAQLNALMQEQSPKDAKKD